MNLKNFLNDLPVGGVSKFAEKIGVSPSYLSQMASGSSNISPENAVKIETETAFAVTRPELRPDDWFLIWPEIREKYPEFIPTDSLST